MTKEVFGVSETEVPPVLYKYFRPERVDLFEEMELHFSRPFEFNDKFDTHYLVPKTQGSTGQAARFRHRSRMGILCLTERADNHLMWVHYAASHTGFVVGFDGAAPFFRDDGRTLGKVNYQPKPSVMSKPDVRACFCKSDKWDYENEWRCVREFQTKESRKVRIEPSLIKQIVFGHRMENWHITRIMQYVTEYVTSHDMIDPQLFLSSPSKDSWAFENHLKSVSVCSCCNGDGYIMKERPLDSPQPNQPE